VIADQDILDPDMLGPAWPPDEQARPTIVVLPESAARHRWDRLLNHETAKRPKAALVGREHTVTADVPYRRGHCPPPARNPTPRDDRTETR
jgi:hypothetical protein